MECTYFNPKDVNEPVGTALCIGIVEFKCKPCKKTAVNPHTNGWERKKGVIYRCKVHALSCCTRVDEFELLVIDSMERGKDE